MNVSARELREPGLADGIAAVPGDLARIYRLVAAPAVATRSATVPPGLAPVSNARAG